MPGEYDILNEEDREIVKKRLREAGLHKTPLRFERNTVITESELRVLEKSIRQLGEPSFREIMAAAPKVTAYRQIARRYKNKKMNRKDPIFAFLGYITPALNHVINDPVLHQQGIEIQIESQADRPFKMGINITRKDQSSKHDFIARFNFNFFLNQKNKPSILLGNIQGGTRENVRWFEEKIGARMLNYIVRRFVHAYPGKDQVVALNPRYHSYMGKGINPRLIAERLTAQGKIDPLENRRFFDGETVSADTLQKINNEMERIQRETPGTHNAAFKKEGFKIGWPERKKRRYRMK